MRNSVTVFSLILLVASACDAQTVDSQPKAATKTSVDGLVVKLDVFAWLAGRWSIVDTDKRVEEIWTAPAKDMMLGMSRTVRDDKTISFEFVRIEARGSGVFYIAQPHGKPPVEFPLKSWDGTQAVFVNPGNTDHLKRIVYRRNADGSMTARIEGANAGKEFAEDYPYQREK